MLRGNLCDGIPPGTGLMQTANHSWHPRIRTETASAQQLVQWHFIQNTALQYHHYLTATLFAYVSNGVKVVVLYIRG